ncbi:MAG: sulfatase [Verrucomicrobiales bacterium]|nr:sulfatase [Verrucomicrobiales bacterium]
MRKFALTLFGVIAAAVCGAADTRPNILYIMSDDHTAHGIGAYGGRLASLNPTPNIDRLAKEGMLFENAFCTNSICAPSRASVITGQYAHTAGAHDLYGTIEGKRQYLPIEMKKAGYETAMIGKWHLKEEPSAFDFYTVLPGQGKYHNPEFRVRGEKGWPNDLIQFDGFHSSDAITDLTLKWLKEERSEEKPFFLMHHYKAPHDYFEHAERYNDYLKDVDIPEPENLWLENQPKFGSIATLGYEGELGPHIGTSIGIRNPRRSYAGDLPKLFPKDFPKNYDPANYTEEEIKRMSYNAYLKNYLRCVKGIDDNLGRLFAYLEETGQMDNTVIIYTGDQGFMLGEHDYQDKRWMYEESMRMPFLIRYPKSIEAGQRTDAIVENVDYAPTMLDFAGVETPEYMQGASFRGICETGQEPADWKQEAYYRYWMHMAHHDNPAHVGIRTKEHKLIFYYGCNYEGRYQTPPAWELYDLKKDPAENVNVYDDPAYAGIAKDLKVRLARLRQRVGDTGEDYPEVEKVVQEFWNYDGEDRAKAIELSSEYLARRTKELAEGTTNDATRLGNQARERIRKEREGKK